RIPGCRDSKNVVSEDLDWSVQLAISYKLSPFRAELLTLPLSAKIAISYLCSTIILLNMVHCKL
ncbi:hypothetical protein QHH03_18035, partial [Aphanizomenon sp. 202]|nr:hypothetical protein [Aphanizomenon sp. 202]